MGRLHDRSFLAEADGVSKVVAISGVDSSPAPRTMLLWGIVFGTAVGIFVGTLMIKPAGKRR